MSKAIPANFFVKIIPGVISATGSAIDLNGLMLSTSTRTPIGTVPSFPDAASVADYYGDSSPEAQAGVDYFKGFIGASVTPNAFLVAQYPMAAVAAWLRGGPLSLTLTQLKALTGVLSVFVDGVEHTSSAIVLTAATSFSNAATILLAAFTTPAFAISYDSVSGAFVVTSGTTGATSAMDFAQGSIAAGLGLTSAMGAVTSQGSDAATPGPFMDGVVEVDSDWCTFFTLFDPDGGAGNTIKEAFAAWTDAQTYRYVYACGDPDLSPTTSNAAAGSLGDILTSAGMSGTALICTPSWEKPSVLAGMIASIDFTEKDGRANMAFRSQDGIAADITSATAAANLKANGYNYYGKVGANKKTFSFFFPGLITGQFQWLDSFVNQVWLNAQLQLDILTLMTVEKSIPYNPEGYGKVEASILPTLQQALDFGAIRTEVPLSASQAAQVNAAAGVAIDQILFTQGWYLQILPATADVREARTSPPCKLWYMDGGSINGIVLNSLLVQ